MKKIILSIVMLVLFAFTVYGLNSKDTAAPHNFYGTLFSERTESVTKCSTYSTPTEDIMTILYENKYYAVVPTLTSVNIINTEDNGCSILTSANTNYSLSSNVETYENYLIFHHNSNRIKMYKFENLSLSLIYEFNKSFNNQSYANNYFSCGYVLNEYDRCYLLDNHDGLTIIDFTDDTNISTSWNNISGYPTGWNLGKTAQAVIRRPLLTNLDNAVPQTLSQLVYLYDGNHNNRMGYASIELSDYSAHAWGDNDDLTTPSAAWDNCYFLSNPQTYAPIDEGDSLLLVYGLRITQADANAAACDLELLKFTTAGSYSVVDEEITKDWQKSSLMNGSELFVFMHNNSDTAYIGGYGADTAGNSRYLVSYNPATTDTYSNKGGVSKGQLQSSYRKFYPSSYQVWNNSDEKSTLFYYTLSDTEYVAPYFIRGIQARIPLKFPANILVSDYAVTLKTYDDGISIINPSNFKDINEAGSNINTNIDSLNHAELSRGMSYFIEDINNDGLMDYLYMLNDNNLVFAYSNYDNSPPSIATILVNAESSVLCKDETYTFLVSYVDIEGDLVFESHKCGDDSAYSDFTTEGEEASPLSIECDTNTTGLKTLAVRIKDIYHETYASYSLNYDVIDNTPPFCSSAGSGYTNLTILSSSGITQQGTGSDTFGMNEIADAAHWGAGQKKLAVILLFIIVGLMGLYTSHNKREGGFNPIGGAITVFAMVGIIYFFFSIGWIGGFFLTLIGIVAAALIVYGVFMSRNAGG